MGLPCAGNWVGRHVGQKSESEIKGSGSRRDSKSAIHDRTGPCQCGNLVESLAARHSCGAGCRKKQSKLRSSVMTNLAVSVVMPSVMESVYMAEGVSVDTC